MKTIMLSATAGALLGLAYGASPAPAASAHPAQIAAPDSGIEQVRTTKRKKVVRSRSTRGTARTTTGGAAGTTGGGGGVGGAAGTTGGGGGVGGAAGTTGGGGGGR
jgi:hypothetical protein